MSTAVLDQPLSRAAQPSASARAATRAFLARAARLRAPAEVGSIDAVLLVVSELVTNAVRHTDGPCTLRLKLLDHSIDVRVTDRSPQHPQPRTPSTQGTGGWGWPLIKRLATHIRIKPMPEGGKTISAELPW
ncbi:ATP-binding protein [Streptomyces virginiae]|uniref:ATP-binding protein n=1 Tax=Streptomyces virginiae TaxID=1961 RepID=UPI0034292BD7